MKQRNFIILFSLLVGLLILWFMTRTDGSEAVSSSDEVSVVRVVRGDLAAFVEATGRVEAERRARLSLPVAGFVAGLYVEVGDVVSERQPLLELELSELLLRQQEAQIGLKVVLARKAEAESGGSTGQIEAAQAQLQAAQLALTVAEAKLDELSAEEQAESEEAVKVEQVRASVEQARASLRRLVDGASAEEQAVLAAQVEQAEFRLTQAKAAIESATLRAPFAGTVTERLIHAAERANPSQPLISIADLERLFIAAEIDEVDVGRVEVGQAVTVTLDAFPTRPLSATLLRLAPASSNERGATTYRATIEFNPLELPIRLDMAADARIRTAEAKDVLLLPQNAIRYAETQPYVLVQRDGQALAQDVLLGAEDERMVEIQAGLQEDEMVEVP
jgi:HlyD family secretion protein